MTDDPQAIQIYGFWRSNAAYRVRVALNLKGVAYREIPVDLDAGAQHEAEFIRRNPQASVPALVEGDLPALTQSLALLEYIEERHPAPPLLPADPRGRARVRSLCCNVACDTHPLLVPRVRKYLAAHTDIGADGFRRWAIHWVGHGLEGLERNLSGSRDTGRFCHGDQVGLADICVAGLVVLGRVLKLDVPDTPVLTAVVDRCLAEPAFARADPSLQAGAPTD